MNYWRSSDPRERAMPQFLHRFCPQIEVRLIRRRIYPLAMAQICSLILALLLLLWCPIPVAADSEDVYLLNQMVSALGPTKVYISKNAIHFICINLGYEAVCRGPSWQVVAFNPKAKVFIKRTLPELTLSGFIPGKWMAPAVLKSEIRGHGQIFGHTYTRYLGTEDHNKSDHHTNNSLTGLDLGQRPIGWEQWDIDDAPFDSHVGDCLSIMSHARAGGGIPIANYSLFQKSAKGWNMKTDSIRKATLAEAGLAYPSLHGYKEIGGVQELCFANKKKELTSFFEDIGVGEEFGGKNKHGSIQAGDQSKK
jgi:hypothetical protein